MTISFEDSDLPAVGYVETSEGGYTYVTVGEWSFCVEEDLEQNRWWDDAKTLIAYAHYLDKIKEERSL